MRKDLAHFTLDGRPLCCCMYTANFERLRAAGSPCCEDTIVVQLEAFAALAREFPGRIALVHGACPAMNTSLSSEDS